MLCGHMRVGNVIASAVPEIRIAIMNQVLNRGHLTAARARWTISARKTGETYDIQALQARRAVVF
jgi:hypothetical protein